MENEKTHSQKTGYISGSEEKEKALRLIDKIIDEVWLLECRLGIGGLSAENIPRRQQEKQEVT